MKNISITVVAILLSAFVAGAAKIPSPTSVRFHITCRVAEKAEWFSGNRATVQLPAISTDDADTALVVNSPQDTNESTVEMADNGMFCNGSFPIDIITVIQPADHLKPATKTLTACWKI